MLIFSSRIFDHLSKIKLCQVLKVQLKSYPLHGAVFGSVCLSPSQVGCALFLLEHLLYLDCIIDISIFFPTKGITLFFPSKE